MHFVPFLDPHVGSSVALHFCSEPVKHGGLPAVLCLLLESVGPSYTFPACVQFLVPWKEKKPHSLFKMNVTCTDMTYLYHSSHQANVLYVIAYEVKVILKSQGQES